MIRVVLADDHAIVRQGIRLILESERDIQVVAEAEDGQEAVQKVVEHQPSVAIIDLSMPILNGVEAARRIKRDSPGVNVLALTMHEDSKYLDAALRAGITGYLPKRAAATDLVQGVRVVDRGITFLHPSLARHVVDGYLRGEHEQSAADRPCISEREREVVQLLAQGYTNREVAEALHISTKTVERHKDNIMGKLHLRNRTELLFYALKESLIAPPSDSSSGVA